MVRDTLDFDLPCVGCSYNLRTLPRDGVCPECGEPVETAVLRHERRQEDMIGLRERGQSTLLALRQGLNCALGAWLLAGLQFAIFMSLHASDPLTAAAWMLLPTAAFVISHFAAWRIGQVTSLWIRFPLRLSLLASVAGTACAYINVRWLRFYRGLEYDLALTGESGARYDSIAPLGEQLLWTQPLATVLTFYCLARCALLANRGLTAVAAVVVGIALVSQQCWEWTVERPRVPYAAWETLAETFGPTGCTVTGWSIALRAFSGRRFTAWYGEELMVGATILVAALLIRSRWIVGRAIKLSTPALPRASDH